MDCRSSKFSCPRLCAIEGIVTTRGLSDDCFAASSSAGISMAVSAKCARTFVPNCSSKPSVVSSRLGGAITPALLIRMSSGRRCASSFSANSRTEASDAWSKIASSVWALGESRSIRARASSPRFLSRQASVTCAPLRASFNAGWKPIPLFAPVIKTRLPLKDGMSAAFQVLLISLLDVATCQLRCELFLLPSMQTSSSSRLAEKRIDHLHILVRLFIGRQVPALLEDNKLRSWNRLVNIPRCNRSDIHVISSRNHQGRELELRELLRQIERPRCPLHRGRALGLSP